MQNILKVSAVALAMVVSGVAVSAAQQAEPGFETSERHGGRHHGGPRGKRGPEVIDINMDGVISDEEAAVMAEQLFARMDRDRNEALSEAEFAAPPRHHRRGWFGWGQEEAAAVSDVRKQKFAAMDLDKNGSVSKAEFFADAKARLLAADADKDGKVSPWEFRAMPRM